MRTLTKAWIGCGVMAIVGISSGVASHSTADDILFSLFFLLFFFLWLLDLVGFSVPEKETKQ